MIEIIKPGNPQKANEPNQVLCNNCDCEFTHTREDCWWNSAVLSYIVSCPNCGKDIYIGDIYEE